MIRISPWISTVFLFGAAALGATNKPVHLLPQLRPGQSFIYLIRFQSDKTAKTESKVVAPLAPSAAQLDAQGLLRVEILDVQQPAAKPTIRARGQFLELDSRVPVKEPHDKDSNGNSQRVDPKGKTIDFTISPDGSVSNVKGLDSFSPEQRQAWQQWVSRFAVAWTLPTGAVKLGEKWESEESEQPGAPLAGLHWERESTYVKDEPCQASQLSIAGEVSPSTAPSDTCAVLLTTAKLKQKSSSKNATPEEFKLHELRTMGTAKGTNEIITYISLKTGLVVRATEETTQFMDVVVAKADGSNGVRYNIDAKSHAEVLLVTQSSLHQP
jgi:hypothetical protein